MAKRPIPTTADMQAAIKRIDPNIPCEVIDPRDLLVASGVSMGLWVYNGVTGGYQLTVRDKANNEWKSFDIGDNANCLEDAAKCFVDFYDAKHKSENHKFNCSMQKKKESLAKKQETKKSEGLEDDVMAVRDMIKELAEETGNNPDTASFETATYGNGVCVTFDNSQEYYCYKTYEDAEEASNEYNKDLLDDIGISGIRFENIGGIEEYVNTDWFEDAAREDAEFYVSDIKESEPERYKEEFGDLDEEDAVEKVFNEMGDDYIDWFKSNFGEKELEQAIKQNNLVDYDKLAEAITEADGPAHGLAGYDGKEIELPCGYYCYRWN